MKSGVFGDIRSAHMLDMLSRYGPPTSIEPAQTEMGTRACVSMCVREKVRMTARARESARAECDKVYRYVGSLFAFRILFLEKLDQRRFVFVVQRLAPTKSTKQKQNKT